LQSSLGALIRTHRRRLGITQEELAWRADMHRTYLADIERGARNVTLRSIEHLAKALELTVGSLFSPLGRAGSAAAPTCRNRGGGPGDILLIEDSATDAELTRRAFQRAKIANPIKLRRDAESALRYLRRCGPRTLPSLILLDLHLPGMSGKEFLALIKADLRTQGIPVIILTISASNRDVLECGRLGAEQYIVKPVGFEGLSRVTSRLDFQWALVNPTR
jgi:CheY-like chemotaxis protein/DNA-binding XRE family transcriptional regulator